MAFWIHAVVCIFPDSVCEMADRRALGSSVHCPTPDTERHISFVGLHSISTGVRAFALHQEQERDHFGTVAIDVHRMFHHDSTTPTHRASGLGWTYAGPPHSLCIELEIPPPPPSFEHSAVPSPVVRLLTGYN